MKIAGPLIALSLLLIFPTLPAQTSSPVPQAPPQQEAPPLPPDASPQTEEPPAPAPSYESAPAVVATHQVNPFNIPAPFSHFAFEGGISTMGINLQAATNLNRYLNLRLLGNVFRLNENNISNSGFLINGTLNLATAGAALDIFPWPQHGFRLSPGLLFYNQNGVSGTAVASGGTSFTLNDVTYYSSPSHPVTAAGNVDLHTMKIAPSATIGWGNLIPRNGSHWSFPFELGAAYTGNPWPVVAFTSGQVCSDKQGNIGCQNVVGNPSVDANLQAQIARDRRSLKPLRFYPILSWGVAYNFNIHRTQ